MAYKLRPAYATMPQLITLVIEPGKEPRAVNLGTSKDVDKVVPATSKLPEHTVKIPAATPEDIEILGPTMPELFELVESKRSSATNVASSVNP